MSAEISLFRDEESVIAHAEVRLESAGSDYAYLLEQYKKLYRQSKRLVKMGDRMQGQLNRLNEELARSEEKYRSIFESSVQGIYRSTVEGRLLDANPAMARIFGFASSGEMMARVANIDLELFLNPSRRASCLEQLRRNGQIKDYPLRLQRRDGAVIWVELNVRGVFDEAGELVEVEGLVADITEKRRMLRELEELARRDGLTGLWNRRYFMELGQREMARALRDNLPLSLIFFDVDHFKSINDVHGHDAGDKVLAELARIVERNLREIDIFGRMGGEEFAALLPGAAVEDAERVAEKLRAAMEAHVVTVGERSIRCTVSLGVTAREGPTDCLCELIQVADKAMYAAKRGGRNRVCRL